VALPLHTGTVESTHFLTQEVTMCKNVWTGTFAAVACAAAIGVAAQTTSPSQTSSSSDKVTVTGCVQRAASMPTGTSGAASSATEKFILSNAMSSDSSKSAGATTGTSGTTASSSTKASATASSYRLDADDSKLTAHVGHKVEVTGTIESDSSTAAASASGSTSGTSASATSSAPKLKVDSVKMIASTCSN
jgi:peptidoglycan DL-endopeptidase CwlO